MMSLQEKPILHSPLHGRSSVSHGRARLSGIIKAERGKVTFVTSQGGDFQTEQLSFHFLKGGEEHPGLGLHLSTILATGGPKAG